MEVFRHIYVDGSVAVVVVIGAFHHVFDGAPGFVDVDVDHGDTVIDGYGFRLLAILCEGNAGYA